MAYKKMTEYEALKVLAEVDKVVADIIRPNHANSSIFLARCGTIIGNKMICNQVTFNIKDGLISIHHPSKAKLVH